MINSTKTWTRHQLNANLDQVEQLLNQPCFRRDAAFTSLTQSLFIDLILFEEKVLQQAEQAGRRIDFSDEVGTNGRVEDITSLIHIMSQSVYDFSKKSTGRIAETQILTPFINHFYGAGVGYFSNGLFFACEHDDELAFFVDRNRVFFYRHLTRAFDEAKRYLQKVILN